MEPTAETVAVAVTETVTEADAIETLERSPEAPDAVADPGAVDCR